MARMIEFDSEREKHRYFSRLEGAEKDAAFREILRSSEHTVFLGGAGVSTESGIPDFRSRDGLYNRKGARDHGRSPEYYLSRECLRREPKEFFAYYRKNLDARKAEPNEAHRCLAALEEKGYLDGIITQNIDGLHQKAGSRNVQEIHGTILRNHCVACGIVYGPDFIFDSREAVPHCPHCGRMVRPDVVLYGEYLPQKAYRNSLALISSADCLIIGGTSLAVGSAAQLAHLYHGPYLIIINRGKTRMEGMADLIFHENIGRVLCRTMEGLKKEYGGSEDNFHA
jgi:NAD-dependent deacetylase